MIRRKRIVAVVGIVAAMVTIAAGGATVAKALGGSATGPMTGRLDMKVQHRSLTKAQRLRLEILQGSQVSTRAEAQRLLRVLGMNPRGFVIQLGKRNYAGPKCPGKGWTCTSSRRVLQAVGDNDFQCTSGDTGSSATPPNQCVVMQTNGGSAKCVENTKATFGPVIQECSITQGPNPNGGNRAEIIQSADQKNSGSAAQDVTQHAFVMQTNGAGSNRSSVRQDVKQSITADGPGGDVLQEQNVHQRVDVQQSTTSGGDNDSNVDQSQDQDEKAQKANSITQRQNADVDFDFSDCPTFSFLDDPTSNQCAAVVQSSNDPNGGKNTSSLNQRINQQQDASKTLSGEQGQGASDPSAGGIDHRFIQASSGLSTQQSKQRETQHQHRSDTGSMTAYQHGPTRKGTGEQSGNPNNRASQDQDAKQDSNGPGALESTEVLVDQCMSSGNCDADQKVDSNGNKAHNHQSGPAIVAFILCGDVGINPPGGDFLRLAAEELPPPCDAGLQETTSID